MNTVKSSSVAVAWAERKKLYAKGTKLYEKADKLYAKGDELCEEAGKLYADGSKLRGEGSKLRADGYSIFVNAVKKEYGNINIKLEWKLSDNGGECHLENGEIYK